MRLIPPVIAADTPSPGERLVFQRFAEEGGAGWTVLHSFDIADPATRLAAEADFVVVIPGKGVLVLEVKGTRRVRRRSGVWLYGDGRHPDERGPFKQAAEAMHAVRGQLVKAHRELAHVVFWSAVCFPFVDFDEVSEEWLPWQVIDRRELRARPLTAFLEAILDRARARLLEHGAPWFHPERGEPDADQCRRLVAALRGDFEVYESPKARARRLDEEVKHYTAEQYEALDAIEDNPRLVFDGPAGTGKTLLAIETARRGAAAGRRVLLLCFNRPLGRWLQEETVELAPLARHRAGVVTRTLHEHMRILAGVTPTPAQACSERFWREELPELAQLALLERIEQARKDGGRSRYLFDEIVLDETQDLLRPSYLDFLDASVAGGLSGGIWRFFGDFEHQRVYDAGALGLEQFMGTGGAPEGGGAAAAYGAARYNLRVNCRNTPSVAELACRCGQVVPGYRRVRRPDDGLQPEIRFWRDAEEQRRLLEETLDELAAQGFGGAATAIISPAGDDRCTAAGLTEPPWRDRVEPLVKEARLLGTTVAPGGEAGAPGGTAAEEAAAAVAEGDWPAACIPSDLDGVELHSGRTRYCSIYRFKGLEAPAVVVTDVESLESPAERSLLYVGCTRALHRLVVLAHASLRERFEPGYPSVAGT